MSSFQSQTAKATTITTTTDTTSQSFATFSTPQLSTWLTTTIKNIPQSILTEIEKEEITGSVAILLDKDDWKGIGFTGLQSAKVIDGINIHLLNDGGNS